MQRASQDISQKTLYFLYGFIVVFLGSIFWAMKERNVAVVSIPFILLIFYWLIYDFRRYILASFFLVPLSIPLENFFGNMGLSVPTEPMIILSTIVVILKLLSGERFNLSIIKHPLFILIVIDLAWHYLTTIFSTMPFVSFKFSIARTWFVIHFFLLTAELGLKNTKTFKQIFQLFLTAAVILIAWNLYHHSQGAFTRHYAYDSMKPFMPDHTIYAAHITFLIMPLFVILTQVFKNKYSIIFIIVTLILFVFFAVAIGLSFTRASWISVFASLGMYVLMRFKINFSYLMMVLFLGTLFFGMNITDIETSLSRNKQDSDDNLEDHVESVTNVSTDPSNLERINRWHSAYRMFQKKPITGFGPGSYTFQYAPFQLSSQMTIISTNAGDVGNVHSEFFRPLSEQGLIGFLIFLSLVLYVSYLALDTNRKCKNDQIKLLNMMAYLSLFTYYIHGIINNYSDYDKIAAPFWGFTACILVCRIMFVKEREHEEKRNLST